MAAIVNSVIESRTTDLLAAFTSMHDLMVIAAPIPEPPLNLVAVRAPGSFPVPKKGHVLIEHVTVTGRNDRIERPAKEAVPLFWRFMIEKLGGFAGDQLEVAVVEEAARRALLRWDDQVVHDEIAVRLPLP